MIELSCECGNEEEFSETTIVTFICDAEGNREEKVEENTSFRCEACGQPAEVYELGN